MKFAAAAAAVAAALIVSSGCSGSNDAKDKKKASTTTTAPSPADGEQVTASMTAADVLGVDAQFATYFGLLDQSDAARILGDDGEYTVFAPVSSSFDALGPDAVKDLEGDPAKLTATVEGQIVEGRHSYTDLLAANETTLDTIDGKKLAVVVNGADVTVGGALIVKSDIDSSNAIIHVVDGLSTTS